MGLTIHYHLKSQMRIIENVRKRMEKLRQFAMDIPFEEVDDHLFELVGNECDFNQCDDEDENRWLLIQAQQYVDIKDPYGGPYTTSYGITPKHIIGFKTWPGEGCEDANFGLCLYPATFTDRYDHTLPTKLHGWRWKSFCKTQYASHPDCGGIKNFLKCHLLVIAMLDEAKRLKLLDYVSDEGNYWDKRNLEALAKESEEWDQMIAGFFGKISDEIKAVDKDAKTLVSEIHKYPNFEHLEAKGRDPVETT